MPEKETTVDRWRLGGSESRGEGQGHRTLPPNSPTSQIASFARGYSHVSPTPERRSDPRRLGSTWELGRNAVPYKGSHVKEGTWGRCGRASRREESHYASWARLAAVHCLVLRPPRLPSHYLGRRIHPPHGYRRRRCLQVRVSRTLPPLLLNNWCPPVTPSPSSLRVESSYRSSMLLQRSPQGQHLSVSRVCFQCRFHVWSPAAELACSFQWHCHRHREEILLHPHRRLHDRQGQIGRAHV